MSNNPNKIRIDRQKWLNITNDMIESGKYVFAEEFLTSVREQMEDGKTPTLKQTQSILNIRRSVDKDFKRPKNA